MRCTAAEHYFFRWRAVQVDRGAYSLAADTVFLEP